MLSGIHEHYAAAWPNNLARLRVFTRLQLFCRLRSPLFPLHIASAEALRCTRTRFPYLDTLDLREDNPCWRKNPPKCYLDMAAVPAHSFYTLQ